MTIKPLEIKELPKAPPLKKLIGPSFILLGLGLGSGELILWPYLTSKYGLGIIWGALIGITFQFFMNMEIERYSLVNGESVFVGFARKWQRMPYWFLISTFLPWIWPGIIATSARFIGALFGLNETKYLAIGLLVIIGLILSFGPVLYKTVERFQKMLICVGVPSVFLLTFVLADRSGWSALALGTLGLGSGYFLLPVGISLASFLAALAYAGAGGNLNLAQSFYIKEKGYGMGQYAGQISGLLKDKREKFSLAGSTFEINSKSLVDFNKWWKSINLEHLLLFWITGLTTILLLALLSYSTTFGHASGTQGINFIFLEAMEIGRRIFPEVGIFFLLIVGLMLFGTQLTVLDATSRILTENLLLVPQKIFMEMSVSKIYYLILWLQIMAGITIFIFGFTQPLQLLILAAVLNAWAMFAHTGLTLCLNLTSLPSKLRPSYARVFAMLMAFVFYGGFSLYTLYDFIF